MFNNIGRKIKTLAKVLCWLGIIASVISGIAMVLTGVAFNSASVVRGYSATGRTLNSAARRRRWRHRDDGRRLARLVDRLLLHVRLRPAG